SAGLQVGDIPRYHPAVVGVAVVVSGPLSIESVFDEAKGTSLRLMECIELDYQLPGVVVRVGHSFRRDDEGVRRVVVGESVAIAVDKDLGVIDERYGAGRIAKRELADGVAD